MPNATKLDVKLFLRSASIEDIEEVIVSLNARRGVLDNEAQFKFKVGDRVRFDAGRRGIIIGVIDGFKRGGKVTVRPDRGLATWSVGGACLKPAS